ncbi:NUDIX hydrolase [Bacillus sp. 1P06AnD]|uniref:NUDIX hydrolase n=1 Tax=Bacillus sp. 1P06AnD TaxID=3132208 RepID=UPI0039A1CF0D
MLPYTICFISCKDNMLLLNREKAPNMGLWNGVGGKIEKGETPLQCIMREIYEETGHAIEHVSSRGEVVWHNEQGTSGMYLFFCELDESSVFADARSTPEGILSWKRTPWILDQKNQGVVDNIPYFLPIAMEGSVMSHQFIYKNSRIVQYKAVSLQSVSK